MFPRTLVTGTIFVLSMSCAAPPDEARFEPDIPRTWDPEEMARFELPLASPEHSPRHVPASYYEGLPVRPIYRSYPVYHPDHEPEGYLDQLAAKDPEIVFDESALETEEDWTQAGRIVFEAPITYAPIAMGLEAVRDPEWYDLHGIPITRDGVVPFAVYVVREAGNVELGQLGCATCHTRVLDDGAVILGGPGNFDFDPSWSRAFREIPRLKEGAPALIHELVAAPWDEDTFTEEHPPDAILDIVDATPRGTIIRQGTSHTHPAKVPDLIGIRDRKYLDATGFVLHRGIGDVMRYAAVNQTMDMLASYGDFIPAGVDYETLPEPGEATFVGTRNRYSDAQLYALGLYLYSLEPPASPNPSNAETERGEAVFTSEGCPVCHEPPLYTNNMLIPAEAALKRTHQASSPSAAASSGMVSVAPMFPSPVAAWQRTDHAGSRSRPRKISAKRGSAIAAAALITLVRSSASAPSTSSSR